MAARRLWRACASLAGRRPLLANVAVGLGFGLASDYAQQRRTVDRPQWDRCARFSLSTVPCTVLLHYWYGWMDARWPGAALRTVLRKVAMDESIMTPTCALSATALLTLLDGKGWPVLKKRLSSSFFLILLCDVCIFAPIQFINFRYFPPKARVMVVYVGAFAYYTLASYALYEFAGVDD